MAPGRGAGPAAHRTVRRRPGPNRRAGRRRASGPDRPGLAGDELVGSLLLLHDLHPDSSSQRVPRAVGRGGTGDPAKGGGSIEVTTSTPSSRGVRDGDGTGQRLRFHRPRRCATRCARRSTTPRPDATIEVRLAVDTTPTPTPVRLGRKPVGAARPMTAPPHTGSDTAPARRRGQRRSPGRARSASAGPRPPRPWTSAARCAPSRSPTGTRPRGRRRASARCCARAAPATSCSLDAVPAAGGTGPCPTATGPYATSRCPRRSGAAPDPGGGGVLLPELERGASAGVLSRARPAPPSACCRSTPGRRWRPPIRCSTTLQPDVEAALIRTDAARPAPAWSASSFPSTPATSWSATSRRLWRGFDGGARPRGHGRLLRPPPGPRDAVGTEDSMAELSIDDRRRRASSRTPPCPRSCASLRLAESTGARGPRHRPAHPGPHRAPAPPLRPGRAGPPPRAVRRAAAVGRYAAAVPVDPRRHHGQPGSTARRWSICPWRARTTSRWPEPSTCTVWTAVRCRCCSCSAAPCSPRATPASPPSWSPGTWSASTGCR